MDVKLVIADVKGLQLILDNMELFNTIEIGKLWDLIYSRPHFSLKRVDPSAFESILQHPKIYNKIIDLFNEFLEYGSKERGREEGPDMSKYFIDIILPWMYNILIDEQTTFDIDAMIKYYSKTKDPKILEFILYWIQNWWMNPEEYSERSVTSNAQVEGFLSGVYQLDKDLWNKIITSIPEPERYMDENLKRKYLQDQVIDNSIALRGTGLPPYVVEEIINHAYDTRSSLGLHQIMSRIAPIIEGKPGINAKSSKKARKR